MNDVERWYGFGDMILVGVADDRDDSDAELDSLDFSEDKRALDVGIEPPLSLLYNAVIVAGAVAAKDVSSESWRSR